MIINIRGTSGSGKTYTVRSFMNVYQPETVIMLDDRRVAAHCVYYNMMPVYVIGSYKNVCGGCDTIPTQDMACSLVRHFSQFGHVLFEGLLMSHSFARYYALCEELTSVGDKFVIAYMDTPLELCIERVKRRRLEKGTTKPFDTRNTVTHYYATLGTKDKFDAKGCDTRWIYHTKDPVKQLRKMLREDVGMQFEYSYREESFR